MKEDIRAPGERRVGERGDAGQGKKWAEARTVVQLNFQRPSHVRPLFGIILIDALWDAHPLSLALRSTESYLIIGFQGDFLTCFFLCF